MGKTGVIIGRFQVPTLHKGHKHLIDSVREKNDNLVILIGTSSHMDVKNPLPFHLRAEMIEEYLADDGNTVVYEIPDRDSDEEWSNYLDRLLDSLEGGVMLYASRDSFIGRYLGKYPVSLIEAVESPSGTVVRSLVAEEALESPVDFRKGIIYAVNNILKN